MTPKLLVLAIRLALMDPACTYFVNQALLRMFRAPIQLEARA